MISLRRHVFWFCAMVTLAAPAPVAAEQRSKPSCIDDAMLVFDASGSMAATDFPDGAPSRLDRVRQALVKVLPAAGRTRRLGLMVYGPGSNFDTCKNVTVRLMPTPNAGERIMAMVDALRPQGRTALTSSVEEAARILHYSERPAVIVALTDGQETCGGDPCGLARQLKAANPRLTVHVIGYRLTPMNGAAPPFSERCLADETGGIFATAETTEQLASALSETLGCPAVTHLVPHLQQ
jgi:Ca-activated chloride channel family protein